MVRQPDPISSGWLDLYFSDKPDWQRTPDGFYTKGIGRQAQVASLHWEEGLEHAYYDQHYERDGAQLVFFRITTNYSRFERALDMMGLTGAP